MKLGTGQNIAMRDSPTARNVSISHFYLPGPQLDFLPLNLRAIVS